MTGWDFHPEAFLDLDKIWDYIAEDSLDAADSVIADILGAVAALVPFPNQGHRRTDLTSRPLRFIAVHQYLIAYAPDEKPFVGDRSDAREEEPSRACRDPQREKVVINAAKCVCPLFPSA
jgi:antitoxin ParD1/3/4/toxin ParE1/3/4